MLFAGLSKELDLTLKKAIPSTLVSGFVFCYLLLLPFAIKV